jgi:hypothetical protein
MDTDEFNPSNEDDIDFLCQRYSTLSIETDHEWTLCQGTTSQEETERNRSWAEIMEDEDPTTESTCAESWIPDTTDSDMPTFIPLKHFPSRSSFSSLPTEDEEVISEETLPEPEKYEEYEEYEEVKMQGIEDHGLKNYCVEDDTPSTLDPQTNQNPLIIHSPTPSRSAYKPLDKIRLTTLLSKPINHKTSLKHLVLLRAAHRSGKHTMFLNSDSGRNDSVEEYMRKRHVVEVWDSCVSRCIQDLGDLDGAVPAGW